MISRHRLVQVRLRDVLGTSKMRVHCGSSSILKVTFLGHPVRTCLSSCSQSFLRPVAKADPKPLCREPPILGAAMWPDYKRGAPGTGKQASFSSSWASSSSSPSSLSSSSSSSSASSSKEHEGASCFRLLAIQLQCKHCHYYRHFVGIIIIITQVSKSHSLTFGLLPWSTTRRLLRA